MFPACRETTDVASILAELAHSDWSESYLGAESEPWRFTVDPNSVARIASLVQDEPGRNRAAPGEPDGRRERRAAPYMYLWMLLNNTPTYRRYEHWVMFELGDEGAHLHVGDDYGFNFPLRVGDEVDVTCRIDAIEEKRGRQGRLVFLDDTWEFRTAEGELAAWLTCKAATLYREGDAEPTPPAKADPGLLEGPRFDGVGPTRESVPEAGLRLPVFEHELTMRENILWMAAVDDYAFTHYDPEYAARHGFPGGRSLLAGPHMGGIITADVARWLGGGAWITGIDHVQRHSVHVGDRVAVTGEVSAVAAGSEGRTDVEIECRLLRDDGSVLNTATVRATLESGDGQ